MEIKCNRIEEALEKANMLKEILTEVNELNEKVHDKEKINLLIEKLMTKIENECDKSVRNEESIFTLTKALTELVSIRANYPDYL